MCFFTHQKTRLSQPNRKPMKNQFKIHTHKPTAATTNPWNKHDPKGNSHNPIHQRATANQTHHHKPTATQHKPTANHNGARPTVRRALRQSESHNEARPTGPGKNWMQADLNPQDQRKQTGFDRWNWSKGGFLLQMGVRSKWSRL